MSDMLVKLYDLPDDVPNIDRLRSQGILIKRVLSADKHKCIAYIRDTFSENWASECDVAFSNQPISCFIAVKDKTIIGFACYEATAKNYFGPTGITATYRGKGIGAALLHKCLLSMREKGYGYAIIGSVGNAVDFYQKKVGAIEINDSSPGIYKRMIEASE